MVILLEFCFLYIPSGIYKFMHLYPKYLQIVENGSRFQKCVPSCSW